MVIECNADGVPDAILPFTNDLRNLILVIRSRCQESFAPRMWEPGLSNLHKLLPPLSRRDQVAVIESELIPVFHADINQLLNKFSPDENAILGLLLRKPPPDSERRFDGYAHSCMCTGSIWEEVIRHRVETFEDLCFTLFAALLNGNTRASNVRICQLPLRKENNKMPVVDHPDIVSIIPHRHPYHYLDVALEYSTHMIWQASSRLAVGLDVEDIAPYISLGLDPSIDLYVCSAVPAGPYVFRQSMIEDAGENIFVYLDSDDVPCSDRFVKLYEALQSSGADMVGSHEFEVNEIDRMIRIYRFPIDVSSVLNRTNNAGVSDNAGEPILHATCMIRRHAFLAAGGLSTNRRIANDSQFLLRASFSMKIANVDEFLYIRRVHQTALTVAKDTHNGNALRRQLSISWGNDYKSIKRGDLRLEDSSLLAQAPAHPHIVRRLAL